MSATKLKELWIAGMPSQYGGADTELDHQIDLWVKLGIELHVVPMEWPPDERMAEFVRRRGCFIHEYRHNIFADKIVVSFCNALFLQRLPYIKLAGPPEKVLYANCMTWTTEAETVAHELGLIDLFMYQTRYQAHRLKQTLPFPARIVEHPYVPYFSAERWPMRYHEPLGFFGVGRISRDDPAKFHPDLWKTYGQITAPLPVRACVMGWDDKLLEKVGDPAEICPWLDVARWAPAALPSDAFYSQLAVLLHITGGSRENCPRTVMEAWGAGVVPILEDDWGLPELIDHGVNGYLVSSPEEASYYATHLAWNEPLRRQMVEAGLETLRARFSNVEVCGASWLALLGN